MSDSETVSTSKTIYFDHTEAFEREFKPQLKALLDRATELGMPLFIAATVRDNEEFLDTNTSSVGVKGVTANTSGRATPRWWVAPGSRRLIPS